MQNKSMNPPSAPPVEVTWSHARQLRVGDLPDGYIRWAILSAAGRIGRPHNVDTIVVVVAVDGAVGDWAAYGMVGAVHPCHAAVHGDKLGEREATILFPDKQGIYRR